MPPLTKEYLASRGKCCGYKCLNCPYKPKHKEGSTIIESKEQSPRKTTEES